MDVKGEVLLQLFNKSKLRNGTKTFLEPKIRVQCSFKSLNVLKGALNPNFFNLTINREKILFEIRFGSIS